MFSPTPYPLKGPAFDRAVEKMKHSTYNNYKLLAAHAQEMKPRKWRDELGSNQRRCFTFVKDEEEWAASGAEADLRAAVDLVPALSLAQVWAKDELRYVVVGTFSGRIVAFGMCSLAAKRESFRRWELLPASLRAWLEDENIFVLVSTHASSRVEDGCSLRRLIGMPQLFAVYQYTGVIWPHFRSDLGDTAWQMAYATAYHHRPSSKAKFSHLIGEPRYAGPWPAWREPGWIPTGVDKLSPQEEFFLFFEAASMHLFVNRLILHGLVYTGMKAVDTTAPLRQLFVTFLEGAEPPALSVERDPLRLRTDWPATSTFNPGDGFFPTPAFSHRQTERGDAAPAADGTAPMEHSGEGAKEEASPSSEEEEEKLEITDNDLVAELQREVEVVGELRRTEKKGEKKPSGPSPTEQLSAPSTSAPEQKSSLAARLGPPNTPPPPRRPLQDRLGPTPVQQKLLSLAGQLLPPPRPAASAAIGGENMEVDAVADPVPDPSPPLMGANADPLGGHQRHPLPDHRPHPGFGPQDVRARLFPEKADAEAHREDAGAQQAHVATCEQDANMQLVADSHRSQGMDKKSSPNITTPTVRFVPIRGGDEPPATPIVKARLSNTRLNRDGRARNPYELQPAFDGRCTFCSAKHCSRVVAGTEEPNCRRFREQLLYARTRDICDYRRCANKRDHHTAVCPALHQRCDRCFCRGHSSSDFCDLRNPAVMRRLRADFEESANLGLYTRHRFQQVEWGFYPIPRVRPPGNFVAYRQLADLPVMDALTTLQSLLLLPENVALAVDHAAPEAASTGVPQAGVPLQGPTRAPEAAVRDGPAGAAAGSAPPPSDAFQAAAAALGVPPDAGESNNNNDDKPQEYDPANPYY